MKDIFSLERFSEYDKDTYKEYQMKVLYGNIAERQYAELPKSCRTCIPKLNWEIDCMTKLRWYEENDERFKKKG